MRSAIRARHPDVDRPLVGGGDVRRSSTVRSGLERGQRLPEQVGRRAAVGGGQQVGRRRRARRRRSPSRSCRSTTTSRCIAASSSWSTPCAASRTCRSTESIRSTSPARAVAHPLDDGQHGPRHRPAQEHRRVQGEAGQPVAPHRGRVLRRGDIPRRQPRAVGEGGVEQLLADAAALHAGPHGVRRQDPGHVAAQRDRRTEDPAVVLGHEAAAGVVPHQVLRPGSASSPASRAPERGLREPSAGAVRRSSRRSRRWSAAPRRRRRLGHRAHHVVGGHRAQPIDGRDPAGWAPCAC